MNAIAQLWMPIVVTAVLIFVASSLIHMVFKWHNSDYRKFGNEDDVRAAVRASTPPGMYIFPHCVDMKDLAGEAMQKKFREGPIGYVTVRPPGPPTMGKQLSLWFIYAIAIAAIAGCLTLGAYPMGRGSAHAAGHMVGLISFLAYVGGSVQMGIWMGKPWLSVAKDALDGLIYGIISALVFWWLWP